MVVYPVLSLPPDGRRSCFRDLIASAGVYAYGYYLLGREPRRYFGFIWIALAGKTFGPLGFLYSAATGALPWSFGWICVFNDIIWWPVFWRFALKYSREHRARRDW